MHKFISAQIYAGLVGLALVAAPTANAGVFHVEYLATDLSYSIDALVTTSDSLNAVGGFDILDIGGTLYGTGGGAITGLVANPNQPGTWLDYGYVYDNVGYSAEPFLDNAGLLFLVGVEAWHLYAYPPGGAGNYFLDGNNPDIAELPGTLTVSAVPLPAALPLYLTAVGIFGLLAWARRKARTPS